MLIQTKGCYTEHGVKTVSEAAILADEYVLAHEGNFVENYVSDNAIAKSVGHLTFRD